MALHPQLHLLLPVALPLFLVARIFYRIWWHPLSHIPGPTLAACSKLYRAYYDIIRDGEWSAHLHRLHAEYGPVVRVGPNELHFSNPDAYNDIYGLANSFTKEPALYRSFGTSGSVFGQLDPHTSQKRRLALGPLFSRRAILKLEKAVLQKHVNLLIGHLATYEEKKVAADLHYAIRSLTLDIITSYCFGSCFSATEYPGFQHPVSTSLEATIYLCWWFKHMPILRTIADTVPEWIVRAVWPATRGFYDQSDHLGAQIDAILEDPAILRQSEHDTMYTYFLENLTDKKGLPGAGGKPLQTMTKKEKQETRHWLLHEGLNLRFAGSETVGNACTTGTFFLLRDEARKKRLVDELLAAWPDVEKPMGYEDFEKLPYLTAVIKESLRLSWGTATPLPRVIGSTGGIVDGVPLPPGTIVAMGNTIVNTNPNVFPDPMTFSPERWLEPDMDKYLVAFSKGPRACLGVNLAWCEMYLIMANLFRKLDLTDDGESSLDDLRYREYFIPLYRGHHMHAFVKKRE
ncbi:hypothetical protein D9613_011342 [Agrocybe pediades]|uniref:Cytochrome P450 monooxygenase n=1 Tax=Agrocybe pediades TaxID=84607 RepID=A0A8H4VN46_9AGAR|nr:hypothetical protein D9613_011342 [Agrocybe pediades]